MVGFEGHFGQIHVESRQTDRNLWAPFCFVPDVFGLIAAVGRGGPPDERPPWNTRHTIGGRAKAGVESGEEAKEEEGRDHLRAPEADLAPGIKPSQDREMGYGPKLGNGCFRLERFGVEV